MYKNRAAFHGEILNLYLYVWSAHLTLWISDDMCVSSPRGGASYLCACLCVCVCVRARIRPSARGLDVGEEEHASAAEGHQLGPRSKPFVGLVPVALVVAPRVRLEVRLDLQERLALGLGHPQVAEHAAEQRGHRVADEVRALAVHLSDGLVQLEHDGGRERDGEHDRGVGQAPGVGREVLALDDGQQRHQPDVDEELGAAHAGQQQPAHPAALVRFHGQHDGNDHVAHGGAHARHHEQRPPPVLVHGERERQARGHYEQPEDHGRGVRRELRVGQHGRRVCLHHAGPAHHLQRGQREHDDQRRPVPVQKVPQLSLATAPNEKKKEYVTKVLEKKKEKSVSNY